LEELVFSKLEVDLKYKLDKLKIEYKMLFVQLELLFKKESLLEEVVLYFMHHEHLKISKVKTLNKILVSKLSRKPLLFHVKQLLTMLDFKELMLYRKFLSSSDKSFGFDASKGEFTNLISNGIIDPKKVVRVALEDAASVSGLMSTTECMIVDKK
jgi:chaperonin GroEL (HSP60 family)